MGKIRWIWGQMHRSDQDTERHLFQTMAPKTSLSSKVTVCKISSAMPRGMARRGWMRSWIQARSLVPWEVKAQFSSTVSCLCPLKPQKHGSHTAAQSSWQLLVFSEEEREVVSSLVPQPSQSQFPEGCVMTSSCFSVDTVKWCYYSYCHDVTAVTL